MQGATQLDIIHINAEISRIIAKHLQKINEGQTTKDDNADEDEDDVHVTKPASALLNLPIWRYFDSLLRHLSMEAIAPIKKAMVIVIKTRLSK